MRLLKLFVISGALWYLFHKKNTDNSSTNEDTDTTISDNRDDVTDSNNVRPSPKIDIFMKDKLLSDIGLISYDLGLPGSKRAFQIYSEKFTVPVRQQRYSQSSGD